MLAPPPKVQLITSPQTLSNIVSFLSTRDALLLRQSNRTTQLAVALRDFAVRSFGKDFVKKREALSTAGESLSTQIVWREFFRDRFDNSPPVVVTIYKVTDKAGDAVNLGCAEDPLYQMQLAHKSTRSVVVGIAVVFDDFLRHLYAKNNAMPGNFVDLRRAGIKLIVTPDVDPHGIGFIKFRVAFYVVGNEASLMTCMHIVLEFVAYKACRWARTPYDVHVYPHNGINVTDLDNKYVICHTPALHLPMGIFEAKPVVQMGIVTMTLHFHGDDDSILVLSGNTWVYRDRFDAIGAIGAWVQDGDMRSFCRILEVSLQSGGRERVWNMLGNGVLKGLAMRVRVRAELKAGTQIHAFVSDLRALPQLHFI